MAGLEMKYFVLKPEGSTQYHVASREAIEAYARSIRNTNWDLSEDLFKWVNKIREAQRSYLD